MAGEKTPPPTSAESAQTPGAPLPDSAYDKPAMRSNTFSTLHGVLTAGSNLLEIADMYAWGLGSHLAVFRTACASCLREASGSEPPARGGTRRGEPIRRVEAGRD